MQKVCGLSQFCRITRADSSSKYPELLQGSSQQQPVGWADGGNSIAVFHLSVTGQLKKYTSPRVFPCVSCQNRLLLVCIHSFSCTALLWKTGGFWLRNIWKPYLTLTACFSSYLDFLIILPDFCGYFCHYFTLPMPFLKWTIAAVRNTLNISSPLSLMNIIVSNSLCVHLIVIAKLHPPN